MPIPEIQQPEVLPVDQDLRLRRFDGKFEFAFNWYQDEETVYLVDSARKKYSRELLEDMYTYLDRQGELYFIEVRTDHGFVPIGDVTFSRDDMPIVIGERAYRGKGIGRKVIRALVQRAKALGYKKLHVHEIYSFNAASRRCFESLGFRACEKTEKGDRFVCELV